MFLQKGGRHLRPPSLLQEHIRDGSSRGAATPRSGCLATEPGMDGSEAVSPSRRLFKQAPRTGDSCRRPDDGGLILKSLLRFHWTLRPARVEIPFLNAEAEPQSFFFFLAKAAEPGELSGSVRAFHWRTDERTKIRPFVSLDRRIVLIFTILRDPHEISKMP